MADQFSVTARYSQALLEAAQRHGVLVPPTLRAALIQPFNARVPMAQQDALWQLLADGVADPLTAMRVGTDLQAGHLDIVGMLLLTCDTLGDALEVLTEYAPIVGDNARFEVVPQEQGVVLRYVPEYRVCLDQRVEAALGCVVCLARWMTNGRFTAREVLFTHAPRADVVAYEAVLGCPVRFNQPCNGVAMDAANLGLSLIQAGKAMHAHLKVMADDMLASLTQGGVSAQVRQLIRDNPRWGKERIGEQLGMSGRNLNRKLAAEAISFKGLREALVYEMAAAALRAGQTVTAVSDKLGFSDENAFSRAFRRWNGKTPAQFARGVGD